MFESLPLSVKNTRAFLLSLPSSCFYSQVKGTDYETADGTCVRDYIDVTDLVDAHVKALNKAERGKVGIYNVGTGRGKPSDRSSPHIMV